jgi:alpha-methylacyl-CoA racemase
MSAAGLLSPEPAEGMLSGRFPYYRSYVCADGRYLAVGPLEPQFRRRLTDRLGLDPSAFDDPEDTAAIEAMFASRTCDEWMALLEGADCCVTPVLTFEEAIRHPHLAERATYVEMEGTMQPAPAPRFSRSSTKIPLSADVSDRLRKWGLPADG